MITSWVLVLAVSSVAPSGPPPAVQALLDRAGILFEAHSKKQQFEGSRLLRQAHKRAPDHLVTMAGMAQACFARSHWGDKPDKRRKFARLGIRWAKRVIKRWPDRAEGYYWAALNFGLLAKSSGVLVAVQEGLAGQIERNGLAALKRNPTLYRGGTQRLLGRYYFKVPWPLRDRKRALTLLEEGHRLGPDNVAGQRYLAEALWSSGKRKRATALFRRCAKGGGGNRDAPGACRDRLR